jgi:hypothetical protein
MGGHEECRVGRLPRVFFTLPCLLVIFTPMNSRLINIC